MSKDIFRLAGVIALHGVAQASKDLAALDGAARTVGDALNRFGKDAARAGATMTIFGKGIAEASKSLVALASSAGQYASNLGTLSLQTGLTTDYLQEMAHVARAAGGSADGLNASAQRLFTQLDSIASGTGEAAAAFQRMGISVTDANGNYRSMNDIFPEVITGLKNITNETERNTVAANIFGRGAKEVTAMMGMTAAQMNALRQEAHDMGLVMSGDALSAADQFRIGIENVKAQVEAVGRDVAAGLMPVLTDGLVPVLENVVVPALQWLSDAAEKIGRVFAALPAPIQGMIPALAGIAAVAGTVVMAVGGLSMAAMKMVVAVGKATAAAKAKTIALAAKTKAVGANTKALIANAAATGAATKATGIMGGAVKALTAAKVGAAGAVKALTAALAANPFTAIAVAVAAATAAVVGLISAKRRLRQEMEAADARAAEGAALMQQMRAAQEAIVEYRKLAGTVEFCEEKYIGMIATLGDLEVAHANVGRAAAAAAGIQMAGPTDEQIRRNAAARHGYAQGVDAARDALQRYRAAQEQATQADAEAARAAAEANRRRLEDLRNLITTREEAYRQLFMTDEQREDRRLELEEAAELERARNLRASEEQLLTIRQYYAQRRHDLEWDRKEAAQKLLDDEADRLREQLAEMKAARGEHYAEWAVKTADQAHEIAQHQARASGRATAVARAEYAARMALLEREYDEKIREARRVGGDLQAVDEYYLNARALQYREYEEAMTQAAREEKEKRAALWSNFASEVTGLMSRLGAFLAQDFQNRSRRAEKYYKDERALVEENAAAGIITEEERAAEMDRLRTEEDAKKLTLEREDAARKKAFAVFQTLVDTATAVVKALTHGPIIGPILATAIGTLGALQTAAIAKEPLPFKTGGIVPGNTYAGDLVPARLNSGEMVLTREQQARLFNMANGGNVTNNNGGATHNVAYHNTVNINAGNVVASDYSVKVFARKISECITLESKRTGRA